MRRSIFALALLAVSCSKEAPSDRLRVSGHVEATETRLAPEAGGRILTLTVKKAIACRRAGRPRSTRETQLAIDRAKAEQAAAAQLRPYRLARESKTFGRRSRIDTARSEVAAARAER
jgi:hypothetical protein